jgi:hypothetical protein
MAALNFRAPAAAIVARPAGIGSVATDTAGGRVTLVQAAPVVGPINQKGAGLVTPATMGLKAVVPMSSQQHLVGSSGISAQVGVASQVALKPPQPSVAASASLAGSIMAAGRVSGATALPPVTASKLISPTTPTVSLTPATHIQVRPGLWIRIRIGDPDPGARKFSEKMHFLVIKKKNVTTKKVLVLV